MRDTYMRKISRDEFFQMLRKTMDTHWKDETVSHVFVVAVHGDSADADDHGAPVTFSHNMSDGKEAAAFLNRIAAALFVLHQVEEDQQTRQ